MIGVRIDVQEPLLRYIELPSGVLSPTVNRSVRPKPARVFKAERDFRERTGGCLEGPSALDFTESVKRANVIPVHGYLNEPSLDRNERPRLAEAPARELACGVQCARQLLSRADLGELSGGRIGLSVVFGLASTPTCDASRVVDSTRVRPAGRKVDKSPGWRSYLTVVVLRTEFAQCPAFKRPVAANRTAVKGAS
jgi:hypothetical protein